MLTYEEVKAFLLPPFFKVLYPIRPRSSRTSGTYSTWFRFGLTFSFIAQGFAKAQNFLNPL